MFQPVLIAILGILALVLVLALARALATPRPRPAGTRLSDSALEEVAGVEESLAACIRHATVSCFGGEGENEAAFSAFKEELKSLFPLVHKHLERREIGDRGLLFIWKGEDPSIPPAILCAHFDVVPAEDALEWQHGPFSGDIAEGCVWGRGSQDIKVTLVCALDAAERLLAEGRKPKRSLYFAFGGDEEVGGNRGAARLSAELSRMGVKASFLLDEGGPIADGMLSFADRPLALVGIAEKGYIDVLLEAEGKGGHASMPPRATAAGSLARAIAALEAKPSGARLTFTTRSFLDRLSPYVAFPYRLLFRNLRLTAPILKVAFSASPSTDAMLRTTTAATMLSGSAKENVLASLATANINMRILPGESVEGTLARVRRIVRPFGVTARPHHPAELVEPLPESPVDHEGWRALEEALEKSFPEAAPVPFLFSAGTDTKHYRNVAEAIYRLSPLLQTAKDLEGVHGRDERVAVDNLRRCALFYKRLIASL